MATINSIRRDKKIKNIPILGSLFFKAERFFLSIKTFIFIHIHAHKSSIHLDDCMRLIGRMDFRQPTNEPYREERNELIARQWETLPQGWAWRRKD